jgi:hypothetical protein
MKMKSAQNLDSVGALGGQSRTDRTRLPQIERGGAPGKTGGALMEGDGSSEESTTRFPGIASSTSGSSSSAKIQRAGRTRDKTRRTKGKRGASKKGASGASQRRRSSLYREIKTTNAFYPTLYKPGLPTGA